MEISLYRRYRPQKFSEVAGQSAAVNVVVKSLERSRTSHAYLFSGPRGCGKTTVARLLAKALNCLSSNGPEPCCECGNCLAITAGESLDVIEIDGASNNSVDEVRELKSHVTLAPFSSKYKIYIIDEVHMLSISAFNALLKTLEEPPAYVVFILATTEAHKVPITIRSRCQHIPFRRIGTREIYDRLVQVCGFESLGHQPEALMEIARQADGALRDALSMLEQVAGLGKEEISLSDVETILGQGSRPSLERWISAWHKGDAETFLELDRMLSGGASPQRFVEELFSLVRNLWLAARWKNVTDALDISDQEKEYLKTESSLWEPRELESIMGFLSDLLPQVRMGLRIDVLSGLLMAKMAHIKDEPLKDEPPVYRSASPSIAPPAPIFDAPKTLETPPKAPEVTAEKPPIDEAPAKIAAPEPLDTADWQPFPKERWDEALKALHEKEFPLYCALMDACHFVDEAGGGRLVLDVGHRYCYEFLRLDRNRSMLKSKLASFNEGKEPVLRHESLWTSCDIQESRDTRRKDSRKRGAKATPEITNFETAESKQDPGIQEPEIKKEDPSKSIPFDGLVREVTRWLSGDVILARRGAEEEDSDDEPSGEE